MRNKNFIGPLSMSQSLIKWVLTGSKAALSIDSASTASGTTGSVASLKKVIQDSATIDSNKCYANDVDIFTDNTQKNWQNNGDQHLAKFA